MVTCGTYLKRPHLSSRSRLARFSAEFMVSAEEFGWKLEAWALLNNHYHFIAASPAEGKQSLGKWLGQLHRKSATWLNQLDSTPARKVWHNYFDTPLTYQKSYFARLNYVHNNPVKHGLVHRAEDYDWCSAAWFAKHATPSFQKVIASFKTDKLNVYDDF